MECHGSIHHLQCLVRCTDDIWPADDVTVEVDAEACRAVGDLPTCPRCGLLARPNILMFGDGGWLPGRTDEQERRYAAWRSVIPEDELTAVGEAYAPDRSGDAAARAAGGDRLTPLPPPGRNSADR